VNVFPIRLPSLRERKEDIPLLVRYLVKKHSAKLGRRIESISEETLERLQAYPWPGNIRELQNVIERAVILSPGSRLEVGEWAPRASLGLEEGGSREARLPTLEELNREHILKVLEQTGGQVSGEKGAAKLLGLKPTTLEARMKKLGIRRQR